MTDCQSYYNTQHPIVNHYSPHNRYHLILNHHSGTMLWQLKENFMLILDVLLMLVSGLLIVLALLQSGKSEGISSAFTGSGGLNLFANAKERGPEKVIANITLGLGLVFFALVILIRVI